MVWRFVRCYHLLLRKGFGNFYWEGDRETIWILLVRVGASHKNRFCWGGGFDWERDSGIFHKVGVSGSSIEMWLTNAHYCYNFVLKS